MSPAETKSTFPSGTYRAVCWDLDTTGKRLIDEICHIGSHYADSSFSRYVMPHRKPNLGAQRSFRILVINVGFYRALQDTHTGQIIKTKSEVAALKEWIAWLKGVKDGDDKCDGLILVRHEPARQVLIPLLLKALGAYGLMPEFAEIVKGFANGADFVKTYGDSTKITSHSLRSLCKTVLGDTDPPTWSAAGRTKALAAVLEATKAEEDTLGEAAARIASTVDAEEKELSSLVAALKARGALAPIFLPRFKLDAKERQKAVRLRSLVVDSGLTYDALAGVYEDNEGEKAAIVLKEKLGEDDALDELIDLLNHHFRPNAKITNNNNKV